VATTNGNQDQNYGMFISYKERYQLLLFDQIGTGRVQPSCLCIIKETCNTTEAILKMERQNMMNATYWQGQLVR
jgi:hypothetical protein